MESIVDRLIDLAIEEDLGRGDITTDAIVPADMRGEAVIEAKEDIVAAGLKAAEKVFLRIDSSLDFEPVIEDGDRVEEYGLIARVNGSIASMLKAERTALNFLQRLSGIATFTNLFAKAIHGTKTKILDTRKTTPGWRELEKEAVRCAGGINHRMGLYDRYLIKNNHIDAAGSIGEAIKRVKEKRTGSLLIEVEVKDLTEVEEAVSMGVDIIMLDNFTPSMVENAVTVVRRRAKIEVSGSINLNNIREYARAGVDYISVGAITHSAPAVDIHMVIS